MSKEIIQVSTDVLKVHPRNAEFFDDIQGKEYEQFKQSISQDGVLSPILVSPDMTVISGHQRLKACKELGIKLVPIMIRDDLTDENEKLKLLLAANFGRTKNNEAKQRKIAAEYVALCGFKHGEIGGGHQIGENRHSGLTQDEIAEQLGISARSLRELLAIENKLTPEIKEMLDNGVFTKTTASKILTKLSAEEQAELVETLPSGTKLTQEEVNTYVEQLKAKDNQIAGYELKLKKIDELNSEISTLKKELSNRPVQEIEVKPDDYDTLVKLNREKDKDNKALRSEYERKCQELSQLKNQVALEKEQGEKNWECNKVIDDAIFFCGKIDAFIRDVGGLAYLSDRINVLPDDEKRAYTKAVSTIKVWAENILMNIDD